MRKLSKKHLEPTTIERQIVQRAFDIFSREMAAAFESYRLDNVSGFIDSQETITPCKKYSGFLA